MFTFTMGTFSQLPAAPSNFFDAAHHLLNKIQQEYDTTSKKMSTTDSETIHYSISGIDAVTNGIAFHTLFKRLFPYTKRPIARLAVVFGAGAALAAFNHGHYKTNTEQALVVGTKTSASLILPAIAFRTLKVGIFPAALYTTFSVGTSVASHEKWY